MNVLERPLLENKLETTPAEFARLLRARGPVFRSEADRFWVVSDHALALSVLKGEDFSADRSAFFASRCPFARIGRFLGVVKRMMVTSDPPQHTARRRLAALGLADGVLDEFRPAVDRAVGRLMAGAGAGGRLELVRDLALPLPCEVLADLFAVPPERRADFQRWSNAMTQFFGGGSDTVERDAFHADEGAASLHGYFTELIAARRRRPQGDFLSRLLAGQAALGLDDDEVISQAVMMLVAGTVTTTDQLCNNAYVLLTQGPARLDSACLEPALEEGTRLDPAVNFVFRAAARDTRLGTAAIKAGELVFISNHAVNRDPRVFADPDAFRLDRGMNPHLSYGAGIHACLGAKLGRIQMKALFSRLLERRPRLPSDAAPVRKQQSLAFSGFESLTLEVS